MPTAELMHSWTQTPVNPISGGVVEHPTNGWFYGTCQNGGTYDHGLIFRFRSTGEIESLVHFTSKGHINQGSGPIGALTLGTDGKFYGATKAGGEFNRGTVFSMTAEGVLTTLTNFPPADPVKHGISPTGGLVLGNNGHFYGITQYGGANDQGTVFKITPAGELTTLHSFNPSFSSGSQPHGSLVLHSNGYFYGIWSSGGRSGGGAIFRISHSGFLTTMAQFGSFNPDFDGTRPGLGLTEGIDGHLYGVTATSDNSNGAVFRMTTAGQLTLVHEFNLPSNGRQPYSTLTAAKNGDLYGTASGGISDHGIIFKVDKEGVFTKMVEFTGGSGPCPGSRPCLLLALGSDGSIYGTTRDGGTYLPGTGTLFSVSPEGQLTTLAIWGEQGSLPGSGVHPSGRVFVDEDGTIHGATSRGGNFNYGSLYRIEPSGSYYTSALFNGHTGTLQGSRPLSSISRGSNGLICGVTYYGGNFDMGTVYMGDSLSNLETVVRFNGAGMYRGSSPVGPMVPGLDGYFYGVTSGDGGNSTIFRVSTEGVMTTLILFSGTQGDFKGMKPSGLMLAADGHFYGITERGGQYNKGTVFRFTHEGEFSTLVEFTGVDGARKGSFPCGTLVQLDDGGLYGLTTHGGHDDFGTFFRVSLSGQLATLHEFKDRPVPDRMGRPSGSLAIGADGLFYGITAAAYGDVDSGGNYGHGAIFRLDRKGGIVKILDFEGMGEGANSGSTPVAGLMARGNHLYGATQRGGPGGGGTLYRLTLPRPKISFTKPVYKAFQYHERIGVLLQKIDSHAALSVQIDMADGPSSLMPPFDAAISGEDYEPYSGRVNLPEGPDQTVQFIKLHPSSGDRKVRRITLKLSAPSGDAILGDFPQAEVLITPVDLIHPEIKLHSPRSRSVSTTLPLRVAGFAGDAKGIERVELSLNDGPPQIAILGTSTQPLSIPFFLDMHPLVGENILVATAYDYSESRTSTSHVFTFERRYKLGLQHRTLSEDVPTPQAGSLKLQASPAKAATVPSPAKGKPFSEVLEGAAIRLTALPAPGYVFSHWEGLPDQANAVANTASFIMPSEDVSGVTAIFTANPFTRGSFVELGNKPVFQGLLLADEVTPAGIATTGFLNAALVPAKGSLSGRLWLDGRVTAFTAVLLGDESVWFTAGRNLLPALSVNGRELSMHWSDDGLAMTLTGAGNETSTGLARPPLYSKNNPVGAALLDARGRQGYYTMGLYGWSQDPPLEPESFPQGIGVGGLTLTANGQFKWAGTLSEGTKFTTSGYLVSGDQAEFFVALPTPGGKTRRGSVMGTLIFDASEPASDVSGSGLQWFRPEAETKPGVAQAYRAGWPEGIALSTSGALYDGSRDLQTVLSLEASAPEGNAELSLQLGKLENAAKFVFNLAGNKPVKLDPKDKSWSLSLTPKTGLVRGVFTPNWPNPAKKLPAFNGIIQQKGSNAGAAGFYLSNQVGDLEPESGWFYIGPRQDP